MPTLKRLALFFYTVSILGLFLAEYAKAVPSIAMIGLAATAIAMMMKNKMSILHKKDLLVISLGFVLLYAIQFFDSSNFAYLLERVQIKLPFIILPLSFLVLPLFTKEDLLKIGIIYIAVTTFTGLFITVRFFAHYDMYIELIAKSQIVPGPINHIRFSIMSVMSALLCYFFLFDQQLTWRKWEKYALIGCLLFTIFFIHIYSVRSGMIALYALVFLILFRRFLKHGNLKTGLLYLAVFIAAPFIAYQSSNAIKSKVTATLNDLSDYRNHKNNEFNSLGKRFVSYEIAFEVLQANPLFGCGIGDLIDTNNAIFKAQHPEIKLIIIPHNQFIYYLMGSGLIGALIFTLSFFYPLFYERNFKNLLVIGQYTILFLSFQTEPMLETQLGVAYSVLFLLYGLSWAKLDQPASDTI